MNSGSEPQAATGQGPDTDEFPSERYAWYVVIVLMACYTLSFIDRQILSLLVGPIKSDLGVSDTQIGLLGGLAFSLFYTLMGLPLGRLVDRHNRRNIITIGVIIWSFMTAACALARSFATLFIARAGVGIGEATLGPGAMSMISDYFRKESLSTALSVYSMGVFIGSGLAFAIGGLVVQAVSATPTMSFPLIGETESWRAVFLIVGIPGIVVGLWVMTLREPVRRNVMLDAAGAQTHLSVREVVREIRKRLGAVAGISFGMMFTGTAGYAFFFWTAPFLQRVHGWNPGQTGLTIGMIFLIMGCLGMYIGGRLADYWLKNGVRDGAMRVGVVSLIGALIFLPAAFLVPGNPILSLVLLSPGVAFAAMPTGVCYAALQMILPNQVRGQAVAAFLFILNIGGLTLGPLMPGVFNDYVFRDPMMVGPSTALTIAIAAAIGLVTFLLALKPYRNAHLEMHPD